MPADDQDSIIFFDNLVGSKVRFASIVILHFAFGVSVYVNPNRTQMLVFGVVFPVYYLHCAHKLILKATPQGTDNLKAADWITFVTSIVVSATILFL